MGKPLNRLDITVNIDVVKAALLTARVRNHFSCKWGRKSVNAIFSDIN